MWYKSTYELLLIIAGIASSLMLQLLSVLKSDKLASKALINILKTQDKKNFYNTNWSLVWS